MPVKADPRRRRLKTLRMILILGCVLFLATWLIKNPCLCAQDFFDRIPKDPAMAAAVMLILYLLKGLTIFFPLIVLEIASGYLFSGWTALLVNFSGILIILTVPYWVGRAAGMEAVHKQVKKHPRFEKILSMQQQNSFFLCFFLRIISCLPGDVVTMYLGGNQNILLEKYSCRKSGAFARNGLSHIHGGKCSAATITGILDFCWADAHALGIFCCRILFVLP